MSLPPAFTPSIAPTAVAALFPTVPAFVPPASADTGLSRPERDAGKRADDAWQRGVTLARQGRDEEARGAFRRAVRLAPSVSLYWLNLASVTRKLRRIPEAIEHARRAHALEPRDLVAAHLLVELLRLTNRNDEAMDVLRAIPADVPRDVQHHLFEGQLLSGKRHYKDAASAFLQVLQMEPGHVPAYSQLGMCLANLQQYAEAAECFRTITMMQPAQLGAAIYAAHYTAWACDWPNAEGDLRRMAEALALQGEQDAVPAFAPFALLSMNDDAAMHRRAAELEARRIAIERRTGITAASANWQAPEPGSGGYPLVTARARKRIGFVSADFRTHATSMLLVRALELLDRDRYEVVLYSHGVDDGTPLQARIRAAADLVVDWAELSSPEQAERIRNDGIAILVDLSGYTRDTRIGVFALRPAPIQVLWLAYPSTTGADWIDYIVGDPILTPLEHQDDFSERIAQLPICYEPTDHHRTHPAAPTRAACGLPDDAFVFACFNQSYKITEDVFSRWCRILHRVPGSLLWLLVPQAPIQASLRRAARERGIDDDRLVFAPYVSPEEHLARLQCADLFLDTFPYGAHTTCSDALWMGLPVLTQIGRSFSARVAASLLSSVGLPELAVENARDYEELAVLIANDPAALGDIRLHLAEHRLELPLFDSERFTHELADLFGRMIERWEAGLPPAALPAAAPHAPSQRAA